MNKKKSATIENFAEKLQSCKTAKITSGDASVLSDICRLLSDEIEMIDVRRGTRAGSGQTPKMKEYNRQIELIETLALADSLSGDTLAEIKEIIGGVIARRDGRHKQTRKASTKLDKLLQSEEGDAIRRVRSESGRKAIEEFRESTPEDELTKIARRGGLRGGPARSANLSEVQRKEIGRKGAQVRWNKEKKKS